jgi:PD-(D/E)XK nuclease superfamily
LGDEMNGLTFDDATHKYAYKGKPVPSVTQILTAGKDISFIPQSALDRGSRVHAAIHESIEGVEGELSADADELCYVRQAMRFLENFQIEHSETMIFNKALWYAGRMDLVGKMNGRRWLIDWKLNGIYESTGPQLAAYQHAWNAKNKRQKIEKCGAVILRENSFELVDADSNRWMTKRRQDFETFRKARNEYECKISDALLSM